LGVIKKDETYPFGKRKYIIPASRNVKKALSLQEVIKPFQAHRKIKPGIFGSSVTCVMELILKMFHSFKTKI